MMYLATVPRERLIASSKRQPLKNDAVNPRPQTLDRRLAASRLLRLPLPSMPGLGAVLTFTLIALLPELGKMSRKQIAVLRLEGVFMSGA